MTRALPQIGDPVIYQTDERGGKRYCLPAIITGTHDSHPDCDLAGAFGGILGNEVFLPDNPVPIPNTLELGCVHLFIMSPGPTAFYVEHSVMRDDSPNPAPRSWRPDARGRA